jgi:archaellum component FlaF (FlaF/FlaG flagellin family)
MKGLTWLAAVATLAGTGCKSRSAGTTTQDVGMASSREVSIGNVQLGRSLSADKRVSGATEKFSTRDTIYASVETSGSAPNTTVNARWTYNGQQVVKEDSRTISATGSDVTEFHITKPSGWPKGKYQFTVTVNGSTQSRDFEVK